MPTLTMIRELTIPEGGDIPWITDSYWKCPHCEQTQYYEDWESNNYYDLEHLIEILQGVQKTWLKVGQEQLIHDVLRNTVREDIEGLRCPNCGEEVEESEVIKPIMFECVQCSDADEFSHAAMRCCSCRCSDPYDDCTCRWGIRTVRDAAGDYHPALEDRVGQTTYYRCHCNRSDEENGCKQMVCVVCHDTTIDLNVIQLHVCPGVPEGKPEVIGKPGSLPDGMTWDELVCVCESGFCCQIHQRHKRGHTVMCWLDS